MEKETIFLEDGIEYLITDKIDNYIYLNNINDIEDFCIRKEIIKNEEEYIIGIDSEEEFYKALELFQKKYQ